MASIASTFPIIRHTVCLAGVWGEASPQAPPEVRWTAGRSRGASQPWAGGAKSKAQAGEAGEAGEVRRHYYIHRHHRDQHDNAEGIAQTKREAAKRERR